MLAFIVFGSAGSNEDFKPQNEFNARHLDRPPGSLDINKAVLYLFLAGILTCVSMVYVAQPHAGAAEPHPDRRRDPLRR